MIDSRDERKGLARMSFKLHQDLANSNALGVDYGYRPLNTFQISASAKDTAKRKNPSVDLPDWVDGNITHAQKIGSTSNTAQVHPRLVSEPELVFVGHHCC
eukprot:TRINITY_DN4938_c0_g1_i1.p1 TRINITY_DN4938_c0_g1~~TRINITY_DN4938_c0_g1_i1.p1  ORF type:complete len:101 (-),score=12.33 TRINITY_DN4938_c0_g1_i1:877-1179(-)